VSAWRPSSSIENLKIRARLLANAREFFNKRDVLEVETPMLAKHAVTEPNIQSLTARFAQQTYYLQTSPEYFMKRLLAAGAPDIYQISKVFRAGETGNNHNPEFTLVEWYRHQFGLQQMMAETVEFICTLFSQPANNIQISYISYFEAMQQAVNLDIKRCAHAELQKVAQQFGIQTDTMLTIDQLYDFLFSGVVIPALNPKVITVIYHFPASQASLAQLCPHDSSLADRFEVFCEGKELANGFVELTNVDEQMTRFRRDQQLRKQLGLDAIEIDENFIAALNHGLPACAGVAVGLDRIAMLATKSKSIRDVISFSWDSI
jgi:lysyl-tRNA synthetase class 2